MSFEYEFIWGLPKFNDDAVVEAFEERVRMAGTDGFAVAGTPSKGPDTLLILERYVDDEDEFDDDEDDEDGDEDDDLDNDPDDDGPTAPAARRPVREDCGETIARLRFETVR